MVRIAISTVEVVAPDGFKSHWAAALPHHAAVAAVRQVIPPGHTAELSIRRFIGGGLRSGEVREIKTMTHPKCPSDPDQTVTSIIDCATGEPRVSPKTWFEYRAYAVGKDGRFAERTEMICRDDGEAIARAKGLASDSDIELWNHNRFVMLLVHRPK